MKSNDVLERIDIFIESHLSVLPKEHPQYLILKELETLIEDAGKQQYFCMDCYNYEQNEMYCSDRKRKMESTATCPFWVDLELAYLHSLVGSKKIMENDYIKPKGDNYV